MLTKVNVKNTLSGGVAQSDMQAFESLADEVITVVETDVAPAADLSDDICGVVLDWW
jgi:hypothetical protein